MTELMLPVSTEEAANELLRRRRAREHLIDYAAYVQPGYEVDPFHNLLGQELELVANGVNDRLIICTPPRHGKTQLSSIHFPAWFMARNPATNVIQGSYNLEQATRASRFTRDIIRGDRFPRLFPQVAVSPESRAAERWSLDRTDVEGSDQEYFAVGVGTGATGKKGGHLIIGDDLIKDREEADSETRRQTIWEWYNDVLYTRLERGGRIVLIMTRWHHDDLVGRLIRAQEAGGDQWRVLSCPALCDDPEKDPLGRDEGEALAPGRKTRDELLRIKNAVGERTWSALFQQKPISTEGAMFLDKWFEKIDRVPVNRKKVRAWDLGSTTNGDYSAGVLMSKDPNGVFYIEDVLRFRGTPLDVETTIFETARLDGRSVEIRLPQDPGQAGLAQVTSLIRRLAGYIVKAVRPTGKKETRANAFAAQAEAGNVKILPRNWNKDFIEELAMFPLGAHDDQVDAASDAFNALIGPQKAAVFDW